MSEGGTPVASEAGVPDSGRRRGRWWRRLGFAVAVLMVVGPLALWEAHTSTIQSRVFTARGESLDWFVRDGISARIRFPQAGPWDERLGYTRIPEIVETARGAGFEIAAQAEVTEAFQQRIDAGWYPIHPEKSQGGLTLLDQGGRPFHRTPAPARVYAEFDSIPEPVWRALLYIENRSFLDTDAPRRNPAVDWPRLARAVGDFGMRLLGSDRNVPGGSTIATQLEKFRHSPEGRTRGPLDKLRQMEAAAMRAYVDGVETLDDRRRAVRDYLNSVPLAAQRGHGEVVGTSDGLWAWFGTDFAEANRVLRSPDEGVTEADRGRVYRQAVSLLVAHRRPSFYLTDSRGREELEGLVDSYLRLMERDSVVAPALTRAAADASVEILDRAPERPPVSFVERKAANLARTGLLTLTGAPGLYELDRYDLTARTTLAFGAQSATATLLSGLADSAVTRVGPFAGPRLLGGADPTRVLYTVTVLESTGTGNAVRVQTDNLDGPLSLSASGRIELGSTAKLRTMVTYLEIVADLHRAMSGLSADTLRARTATARDPLTRFVASHLADDPTLGKRALLSDAMLRRYSASPRERFATGGGVQTFRNFDATFDGQSLTVREAFRHSVNLPFIRMMRDLVDYAMHLGPEPTVRVLEDVDDPTRRAYLERFADREGTRFMRDFHGRYAGAPGDSIVSRMVAGRTLGPTRTAWAIRSLRPDLEPDAFEAELRAATPFAGLPPGVASDLYARTDPTPWGWNDLGYLSRIHPLELWVAQRMLDDPEIALDRLLEEGRDVRQEVYEWLFRTSRRNAQDQRIRAMLEIEAFQVLHARWRRLGYPFAHLVPSLGTAIGSSGDRPLALAELMGIIMNDGVRRPTVRVEELHLAQGTPFETRLRRYPPRGDPVMDPEVAATVREAMVDVVESGTARRARGGAMDADGMPLILGAKTGTGDNRYQVYGAGGALLESRVVNRTASIVFFVGARHYGVVTAFVPGPEAGEYRFTSALPSEIVRTLAPVLGALARGEVVDEADVDASISAALAGVVPAG